MTYCGIQKLRDMLLHVMLKSFVRRRHSTEECSGNKWCTVRDFITIEVIYILIFIYCKVSLQYYFVCLRTDSSNHFFFNFRICPETYT